MIIQATIHLENIDNNIISLIKNAIKIYPNAKMKVSKKKSLADELNKKVDVMMKDYKAGKLKSFKNIEEYSKSRLGSHSDLF